MDNFTGPIHYPSSSGYDRARLPWNLAVNPRPAIVAEAANVADVQAAVRAAEKRELPLSVQATGHGTLVPYTGILLTTSRLNQVRIDPHRREALVGAGALWSDVIAAAAPYGLAPLSGTPWIGVTGYTTGGGAGWLSRKYGLAADSLVSAQIVTSDGELRRAEDDLLWALRGGSGNFGVVTELTLRLFPVDRVVAGMTFHPIDRAPAILAAFDDLDQPDSLNTAVILAGPTVIIRTVAVDGAERALEPLLAAAGTPLQGGLAPMTFQEAGTALAPEHPPTAIHSRFEMVERLPVDALLGSAAQGIEIRRWGGAMGRSDSPAGGNLAVPFSVMSSEPMEVPGATGGTFLNFLMDPERTASAYNAADHARLRELKKWWDPDALFRPSHFLGE
ncbi:FAD-binding oxidoreductase [Nonomuraea sp. NPDC050556]|uniref:FAD-binding oxidoreductase n=1 Tax=Nonomuraea sp. NPDC050556 TaxID=3364369 RepID=UPI00378E5337